MREIKFRAWDKSKKKFVDGSYYRDFGISFNGDVLTRDNNGACGDPECCGNYEEYLSDHEKDNFILMQSTNLKDKNGVVIYEGDVLRTNLGNGEVYYDGGCFWCEACILQHELSDRECEVIGDIYSNPSLLKEST